MHESNLKLKDINRSKKVTERVFRASDYLTEEQMDEVRISNAKGKKINRPYDEIDAIGAEMLARFGWATYEKWLSGEFDLQKSLRFIAAERAREKQNMIHLEAIIISSVAGANNPTKNGAPPRSLKQAYDMLQKEIKLAQGEQDGN